MKVLIAGDFCPCNRVAEAINKSDFASVLEDVRNVTASADYSIVNFECPVVIGNAKPIIKQGPNLKCTPKGVKAIKYAGFNCATLANNHFLDYGKEGVEETILSLEKEGIDHVGGGMNLTEASKTLYKEIDGLRLAIINCCEHEFSIATETTAGSNPINLVWQYNAIQEAHKSADRVLVIIHGGHEHFQLPSSRMIDTYRFFIDVGADAVINHHQHCFSGYEVYNGKPIFYGLGNFCFDLPGYQSGIWTEGIMTVIDFSSNLPSFKIIPFLQCASNAKVELQPAGQFDNKLKELNETFLDRNKLNAIIKDYYSSGTDQYSRVFEPIRNRFVMGAINRGWLPSFICKQRFLAAYNYIFCESHRDKLMYWLNMY